MCRMTMARRSRHGWLERRGNAPSRQMTAVPPKDGPQNPAYKFGSFLHISGIAAMKALPARESFFV